MLSKSKARQVIALGAAIALALGAIPVSAAYGSPATGSEEQAAQRMADANAVGQDSLSASGAGELESNGAAAELGAQLETMSVQSSSSISAGETKSLTLQYERRADFTFECVESGLYTFSQDEADASGGRVYTLVVSDDESKKILKYANGYSSLSFSAEAGKRYLLSAAGDGECALSLAKHESYTGSESLRITKVNGKATDEGYGLYVPVAAGDSIELQAQIPLWQLVPANEEGQITDKFVIGYRDGLLGEDGGTWDVRLALGSQAIARSDETADNDFDYSSPDSWYDDASLDISLKEAGKAKLKKAFDEDCNASLVITATISNIAEPTEGEWYNHGVDGYPSWSGSDLGESEYTMYFGPRGYALSLSYKSALDGQEIRRNRIALNAALDLLTLVTDEDGKAIKLTPKVYDEEADDPRVTEFARYGSNDETYVVYLEDKDGNAMWPEADGEKSQGWVEGLNIITESGGYGTEYLQPVCFPNVECGTYTIVCQGKRGDEELETIRRQIVIKQGAEHITGRNEVGYQVEYDGEEVPFHSYGRLLGAGEDGSTTTRMPSLPFGTLNGAVVTMAIPQETSPVVMKVVTGDGSLADARTAAYGETITFRTTAKVSEGDQGGQGAEFTYTFPDSNLSDWGSGEDGGETARPFDVTVDDVSITAKLADGTEHRLQRADTEDPEAYDRAITSGSPFFTADYDSEEPWGPGDLGHQALRISIEASENAQSVLKGATLTIDVPAKLTDSVSCGGYGNAVRLSGTVNGEDHTDVNVVYTGTFILQTIDTGGNPLDGAAFTIEKDGDSDLTVGAVQGLSMHAVPEAVFTNGGDTENLKMVGHAAEETRGLEGESVGEGTGCLSYAGVDQGTYRLTETKFPSDGWRPREMPQPIRLELTAHVPETIISGGEYCRWSVKLNARDLPELLRYQMGLLDPALPNEAYLDSFIAYSCQSSTIVLRALHVQNDITANVVWNDEGLESERPAYAHLQLTRNGQDIGSPVVVNAGGWSNVWRALKSERGANDEWRIVETNDWSVTEESLAAQSGLSAQPGLSAQSEEQGDTLAAASSQRQYLTTYSDLTYDHDEQSDQDSATITVTNTPILNVTFDSAGGSAVDPQRVAKGRLAVEPAMPTRDGHTFDGWFLDDSPYDFSSAVETDVTLVAHWTKGGAVPNTDSKASANSTTDTKTENADSTPSPVRGAQENAIPSPAPKANVITMTAASKTTLPKTGDPTSIAAVGGAIGGTLLGLGALRRRRK